MSSVPTFVLWFAGRVDGESPGTGGCAAVCKREGSHSSDNEPIWTVSRRMGTVGGNAPEYFGLIHGIRRLLQEIPVHEFNVTIMGSSEQTLCEMIGEKKVVSPSTQLYFEVANGLVKRIKGEVTWELVTQAENGEADYLAEKASKKDLEDGDYFVLEPSSMNFLSAEIDGQKIVAGHDAGSEVHTPEILVDAGTVREILGQEALGNIQDSGMTTVIDGKVQMTVLGTLSGLTFVMFQDHGIEEVTVESAVVVDFLPYPIQISLDHPQVAEVLEDGPGWSISSTTGQEMSKSVLPVRFQAHAFWATSTPTSPVAVGHSLD